FTNFTKALHDFGFATNVLLVVDLPRLELHLKSQEIFLDRSVVGQLLADDAIDFVQRPLRSPNGAEEWSEQYVGNKSHEVRPASGCLLQLQLDIHEIVRRPRSGVFEREQLFVLQADCFHAFVDRKDERSTRKAALRIMRSPMTLLLRLA